ncbi:hypothetical protein EON65_24935 [archaeon]|nr:MAG: hypothetical protein EON65_24935 [archaeon]
MPCKPINSGLINTRQHCIHSFLLAVRNRRILVKVFLLSFCDLLCYAAFNHGRNQKKSRPATIDLQALHFLPLPQLTMDHAVMNDLLNKDSEKGCKLISALRNEGMSPFSSTILLERCRHFINEGTCDIIAHLLLYLASLASNMKVIDPIRRGCTQIVPGLIAQPIWNTSLFPWIAKLEAATSDIRNEFLALRGHTGPCEGFQTYSDSTVAQGDWHVCYLQLHTVDFAANRALCPLTMEAIG